MNAPTRSYFDQVTDELSDTPRPTRGLRNMLNFRDDPEDEADELDEEVADIQNLRASFDHLQASIAANCNPQRKEGE